MGDDKVHGNEFVMNVDKAEYETSGDHWRRLADMRADATQRDVVIVIDGSVVYRAPKPLEQNDKSLSPQAH